MTTTALVQELKQADQDFEWFPTTPEIIQRIADDIDDGHPLSRTHLASILGAPVDRPVVTETTALGAAYLAGLKAGICPAPQEFQKTWALERRFTPAMDDRTRNAKYTRWGRAVAATMSV
jgi:hypothetical protein